MIQKTFEEYDKEVELFEECKKSKKMHPVWPTVNQIDRFYKSPQQWLRFVCYLYETNPAPANAAERYSKANMQQFIHDTLELI